MKNIMTDNLANNEMPNEEMNELMDAAEAIERRILEKRNTINICKEMGQEVPANVQIEFKVSYGGGYYLTTDLELKGRGIRMSGDGSDHKRGKKTYHVTEKAMNKLEGQYKCAYMELL